MSMQEEPILYFEHRAEWRSWLDKNFKTATGIWFVFPKKSSGKKAVSYNDAVEEALCFGWIDSIHKTLDIHHSKQRFSPRKTKNYYSRPNIERLLWLIENKLVHPSVLEEVNNYVKKPFVFPEDIMNELKKDPVVWENYNHFSEGYQRIRIAYIEDARKLPIEFRKRLDNFIKKTSQNKLIVGHGGIDKYYL
jgi:uncharacterized protein YdeI (YjbR/CyaY-like superfamily)